MDQHLAAPRAQAPLRADQFRGGNASGGNALCNFARKFARQSCVGSRIAAATGYALFLFISKYVHHVCPACAASHFDADATRHFSEIATALIVALAIHSTTDGLALGIQQEAPSTDATKWSLFSALCIHKVPEGLALGSLLIGAGLQRSGALGWVAAVEATTLLGGVIGISAWGKFRLFGSA